MYRVQEMNHQEMVEANGGMSDRPFGRPDYGQSKPVSGSSNGLLQSSTPKSDAAFFAIAVAILTLFK